MGGRLPPSAASFKFRGDDTITDGPIPVRGTEGKPDDRKRAAATEPEAGPVTGEKGAPEGERGGGGAVVRRAGATPLEEVAAGEGARMQVLVGPEDGAPNFALRRFVMEEGGGMPLHTNEVEHEQYVLRGRARIRVGGEVHEVGPDDSLYIPAGTPHDYQVVEGPFEFVCVVPNARDEIHLVEE